MESEPSDSRAPWRIRLQPASAAADPRTDTALVEAVRSGATEAYAVLVERYARAAFAVALAATGVPADAEDAVQDALVQAYAQLAECREAHRFGAWLLRIVRNRAHNVRRYEQVRENQSLTEIRVAASEATDALAERRELRARLVGALQAEPEIRRQVLLLHDLEGWKHSDVAQALGISVFMSRHHLSAARRSMRARLSAYRLETELP